MCIYTCLRVIGVIGGIFVCMGYAVRFGVKAIEVVTGKEDVISAAPVQASGVRRKWVGGELRSRGKNGSISRVVQQGNGWVVEKDSPYGSPVASPTSPYTNGTMPTFGPPSAGSAGLKIPPAHNRSTSHGSGSLTSSIRHSQTPSYGGPPPISPYTPSSYTSRSPYTPSALARFASTSTTDSIPPSPVAGYAHFPPTPAPSAGFGLGVDSQNANGNGHADSIGVDHGLPRSISDGVKDSKKDD
jgi:endoplasmic reticulum-Golgi intermediate compartment protein 2